MNFLNDESNYERKIASAPNVNVEIISNHENDEVVKSDNPNLDNNFNHFVMVMYMDKPRKDYTIDKQDIV
jgi:hypothetical protein